MRLGCLLVAALSLLPCDALQLSTLTQSHAHARSAQTRSTRGLTLPAKKSNGKREEINDTPPKANFLQLVLTYATPWRNPNSIFIYFFLVIYGIDSLDWAPLHTISIDTRNLCKCAFAQLLLLVYSTAAAVLRLETCDERLNRGSK